MPSYSKMASLPIEGSSVQHYAQAQVDHHLPMATPPRSNISAMHGPRSCASYTNRLASRFSSANARTNQFAVHDDYDQDRTPSDGGKEFVWNCCQCGDGGMSTWNSSCHTCGHERCSRGCGVEEV